MFQKSPAQLRAANAFQRRDLIAQHTPEKPPEKVTAKSYDEIRVRVLEEGRTQEKKP